MGGVLSLWLGISVMVAVELLELLHSLLIDGSKNKTSAEEKKSVGVDQGASTIPIVLAGLAFGLGIGLLAAALVEALNRTSDHT